jgi:hypothetical protein
MNPNPNNRDERAIMLTNNGLYKPIKEKMYRMSTLRSETFGGMGYSESLTNHPRGGRKKEKIEQSHSAYDQAAAAMGQPNFDAMNKQWLFRFQKE